MNMRDRYRGALLGLAAGDAVGTTVGFVPLRGASWELTASSRPVCARPIWETTPIRRPPCAARSRERTAGPKASRVGWRSRLAMHDEKVALADALHDGRSR
jgi:hypothetical protein